MASRFRILALVIFYLTSAIGAGWRARSARVTHKVDKETPAPLFLKSTQGQVTGLFAKTTLALAGRLCRLWVRSAVLEGQDSPNQQDGGSKDRPPARNNEKRHARYCKQHRPHAGSTQCDHH